MNQKLQDLVGGLYFIIQNHADVEEFDEMEKFIWLKAGEVVLGEDAFRDCQGFQRESP